MALHPFENTEAIAFELSNICPLAWRHAACPLHIAQEPKILPTQVVFNCLDTLRKYEWKGVVSFHQYNEPMIDPRLMGLISIVRIELGDVPIELETSGFYLSREIAEDLADYHNITLHVSLYGTEEEKQRRAERLQREVAPIVETKLGWHGFDDRLSIYQMPQSNNGRPCKEPLCYLTVTCDAKVGLCCFDWKRTATFGDLREQFLDDILWGERLQRVYAELSRGERTLDVCLRCPRARGC